MFDKNLNTQEDINIWENTDLGNCVCLDRVKKFSYLGDILGGGANLACVGRVHCDWEYLEPSEILTMNYASLKLKGKVHVTHVRSTMVYGRETWAMN